MVHRNVNVARDTSSGFSAGPMISYLHQDFGTMAGRRFSFASAVSNINRNRMSTTTAHPRI